MDKLKENIETDWVELETVAPIHIGGKDDNYGEDLVRLPGDNKYAYLIDNDVLAEWLYEKAPANNKLLYIEDYTRFFTDESLDGFFKRYDIDVADFLKKNGKSISIIDSAEYERLKKNKEYLKGIFKVDSKYYKFNNIRSATKIVKGYLKEPRKLDDYYINNITLFLKDNYYGKQTLLQALVEIKQDDRRFKIFKGKTYIGPKNAFIADGKGQHYLPGSSLKGCFKTAVLYSLLKNEKDNKANFLVDYKNKIQQRVSLFYSNKIELREFADNLLKDKFSDSDRIPVGWQKHKPKEQNLDFFRCLQISDAKIELRSNQQPNQQRQQSQLSGEEWEVNLMMGKLFMYHKALPVFPIHAADIIKFELKLGDRLTFCKTGKKNRILDCEKIAVTPKKKGKQIKQQSHIKNEFEKEKIYVASLRLPIRIRSTVFDTISNIDDKTYLQQYYRKNPDGLEYQMSQQLRDERAKTEIAEKLTKFRIPLELKQKRSIGEYKCFTGTTSFRISLNHNMLAQFFPNDKDKPFKNIDDLLSKVKEFTKALWQEEVDFLKYDAIIPDKTKFQQIENFYNTDRDVSCRLGWGTGLLGMTVLTLFDKKAGVRQDIRNLRKNYGNTIAPKSRRFIGDDKGDFYRPLGWCKLRKIQKNKDILNES